MPDTRSFPCPRCQVGHLKPDRATYTGVHRGALVSVPGMPSWTCDICQHQEFDEAALLDLKALLGLSPYAASLEAPAGKRSSRDGEPVAANGRIRRAKP